VAPYLGSDNFHVEGYSLNQSTVSSVRTTQFFERGLWICDAGYIGLTSSNSYVII
jgi:hypothetical protein